jgi:putative RecB family exonuclease
MGLPSAARDPDRRSARPELRVTSGVTILVDVDDLSAARKPGMRYHAGTMGPGAVCLRSSHVSVTRLQAFRKCPLSFKLKYIDGHPTKPSREAQRGSLVHAVLADHLLRIQGTDGESPTRPETLLQLVRPVSRRLSDEGTITERFDASEIAPFLHNFATIVPSIAGHLISAVEAVKYTSLMSTGDRWVLKSVLDLVLEDASGCRAIIDFKTGSARYVTPFQLETYALPVLGSPDYAKNRVDLIYVYLKEGTRSRWLMYREQCPRVVTEIIKNIRQIEAERSFPARVSRLCNWCDVCRFCKNRPT